MSLITYLIEIYYIELTNSPPSKYMVHLILKNWLENSLIKKRKLSDSIYWWPRPTNGQFYRI